jgi:hypothetical protein
MKFGCVCVRVRACVRATYVLTSTQEYSHCEISDGGVDEDVNFPSGYAVYVVNSPLGLLNSEGEGITFFRNVRDCLPFYMA